MKTTEICSMNEGSASWFLSSSPINNFEELHEKVLVYEVLQRNAAAVKSSRVSVNAVDYIRKEGPKKQEDQDKGTPQDTNRCQRRNLEGYTFDINNTNNNRDMNNNH